MPYHSEGLVILRRLLNRNCVGERYTRKQRVLSWGKHLSTKRRRAFIESYDEFLRNEWLLEKTKPDGQVTSLNPVRLREIREALQ